MANNITTRGYHDEVTFPMIVRGYAAGGNTARRVDVINLQQCLSVDRLPLFRDAHCANADFAMTMRGRWVSSAPQWTNGLTLDVGYRPGERWWSLLRERRAGHRRILS